jgi:hypothetical protein
MSARKIDDDPQTAAILRQMWADGVSLQRMRVRLGVGSIATVAAAAARLGLPARPVRDHRPRLKRPPDAG